MNKPKLTFAATFLAMAAGLSAQTPPSKVLGSAPTNWPGVRIEISDIVRVAPEHILVAVRLRGDATVKNPTLIGFSKPTPENPNHVAPFTLLSAKMTDQTTGTQYKADNKLPTTPYWGDSDVISNIRPGGWFQLAARFKAPPSLPPDAQGKKQPQLVTFHLPEATEPIKDVPLP
jgi:hypothetical protein